MYIQGILITLCLCLSYCHWVQSKIISNKKNQIGSPMLLDTQERENQQQLTVQKNIPRLCLNELPPFSSSSLSSSSLSSSPLSSLSLSSSPSLPLSVLSPSLLSPSSASSSSTLDSSSFSASSQIFSLKEENKSNHHHKRRHQRSHQRHSKLKCITIKTHSSKLAYLEPLCVNNYLQILGKSVRATSPKSSIDNAFRITYVTLRDRRSHGILVSIQEVRSGKFVCFNKKGRIVAKKDGQWDVSCLFKEKDTGVWKKYQSFYNDNWFLGFDLKGRPIRGTINRRNRRNPQRHGSKRRKIRRSCYEFARINIK